MGFVNNIDKQRIIDTLTQAFLEDDCVTYVIKHDKNHSKRVRALIEYSYKWGEYCGKFYTNNDCSAVILSLDAQRRTYNFRAVLWDLILTRDSLGICKLPQAFRREMKIKECHAPNAIYLWYIGVLPEKQNQGLGTELMKKIIEDSEAQKRPIYLETTLDRNVQFYKSFGFEIFHTLHFDKPLYMLRREIPKEKNK